MVYNAIMEWKHGYKSLQAINSKNLVVVDASKGSTPITNTDLELVKNDDSMSIYG